MKDNVLLRMTDYLSPTLHTCLVQAVIDFTHSTRAMLITLGVASSRLRLPRSWGEVRQFP